MVTLTNGTNAIQLLKALMSEKRRSCMGSFHHYANCIPNLAQLCHPYRTLLKKNTAFAGLRSMRVNLGQLELKKLKQAKSNVSLLISKLELNAKHHDNDEDLKQLTLGGWQTVLFASRF